MKITDTMVKMRAAMDKQNATRTVMRILESRVERTNQTLIYIYVEYGMLYGYIKQRS